MKNTPFKEEDWGKKRGDRKQMQWPTGEVWGWEVGNGRRYRETLAKEFLWKTEVLCSGRRFWGAMNGISNSGVFII